MKLMLLKFLLILSFVSPYIVRSASLSSNTLLGVSPEDERYYSTSSEFIKCKDGSKKFHRSQLNDDFCDCPDGSDEPGTSACPNGRFYCRNAGHMPLIVFSSRVNDGICDCCDGSDEYDGKIKCPNTCWEAGKAARDKLKKKIATYQEGVTLRKKEVEQAKQAFSKDEAELSRLMDEEKLLKGLVQQLKERKEQIEKAEEKERLEKEKEEKLKKEAEKESNQEKKEAEEKAESGKENNDDMTHDTASDFHDSLDEVDGQVGSEIEHEDSSEKERSNSNAAELPTKENSEEDTAASDPKHENTAETESTEGLSKEELGRLVASRWTGEKTDQKTSDADVAKEISGAEETPKNEQDDDYEGYASEFDEPDHRYDDPDSDDHVNDDFADEDHGDSASYKSDSEDESVDSDVSVSSNPSWLEKIQNTVKSLLHAVNLFQTPLNTSDAARVRKEYDESSAKLSKIQSRISSLSDKLKLDFGPEKEFYSLYGHCFETKQNKYSRKEPTSYLHETDPTYYNAYDRGFISEDKKEETVEEENMKNDVNNSALDYMNQEVQVVDCSDLDFMNEEVQVKDCQSYANDVHNEGMFILDSNMDAFIGTHNEEDVQLPIQVNEKSKIIANNSSIIPHEYSLNIQESDHMQRKFEIGQAVSIHANAEFIIPDRVFMDTTLHSMSGLESEYVDLFIPNELLVSKKLHPLIALLLFLES